jgi:hypothetical protein
VPQLASPHLLAGLAVQRHEPGVVLEHEQPVPHDDRRELEQHVAHPGPAPLERRMELLARLQVAAAVLRVAVLVPAEAGERVALARLGRRLGVGVGERRLRGLDPELEPRLGERRLGGAVQREHGPRRGEDERRDTEPDHDRPPERARSVGWHERVRVAGPPDTHP